MNERVGSQNVIFPNVILFPWAKQMIFHGWKQSQNTLEKSNVPTTFCLRVRKLFVIMEKLLQWAINNTDQDQLRKDADAIKRGEMQPDLSKFDPKIIEAILGKDDATRMKGISRLTHLFCCSNHHNPCCLNIRGCWMHIGSQGYCGKQSYCSR